MPTFGKGSLHQLSLAEPHLQAIMNEAIKHYDFIILQSQRGRIEQELAVKLGHSQVHFGSSAHNWSPSIALDIAPWPVDWDDLKRFIHLQMDIIRPIAADLKIPIRQGLDWNRNGILTDEHFKDYPHVELHPWREWAKKVKPFEGDK